MNYLPHTADDIAAMLESCGAESIDDLYADVDPSLRLKAPYDLPDGLSEPEVAAFFADMAGRNTTLRCFAGAGFYNHYTPAAINTLLSRSEFSTAYTPYQPEISQGTLQYIFEYQTMMARLTDMDICNASMYDGATATAEAMLMAVANSRRRKRVLIAETVNPAVRQTVATYADWQGITLDAIPATDGQTYAEQLRSMLEADDVAGVIVATPNYYGIIEDLTGWADLCHSHKALLIVNAPASPLAVLQTPGSWGADIACGDAQSLGMPLNFGGPYLGYLCCTQALMRRLPGRIVGATIDNRGQRTFVLTLQAREQHIRREKATSNICSNQGLMALHTAIYLSLMGPEGLRRVNAIGAEMLRRFTAAMAEAGVMHRRYPDAPVLNEAVFTLTDGLSADSLIAEAARAGILAGVKIDDRSLLIACTELTTDDDINRYVSLAKHLR